MKSNDNSDNLSNALFNQTNTVSDIEQKNKTQEEELDMMSKEDKDPYPYKDAISEGKLPIPNSL
ncbi:MAG: hypothetical protein RCG15_02575 [Candidatus Rickettsia vulgarisii]